MFWGVTLEPGKKYSQIVSSSFHCTMAALEPLQDVTIQEDNRLVSIMIEHQKSEYVLCTLEHGKLYQQPLQLNFVEGEEISFYTLGQGLVHLTGYHMEDPHYDNSLMLEDGSSLEEEEDEESSLDSDIEEIPTLVSIKDRTLPDGSDEDDGDWIPVKGKRNAKSLVSSIKKMKNSGMKITELKDGKDIKKIKELRKDLAGKTNAAKNGKLADNDDDEDESDTESDDYDDEDETDASDDSELDELVNRKRKGQASEPVSKKMKPSSMKITEITDNNKSKLQKKESIGKSNITNGSVEVDDDEEDDDDDSEDDDDDDSEDDDDDESEDSEEEKTVKVTSPVKNQPKIIPEKTTPKSQSPVKKSEDKKLSDTPKTNTLPGGTKVSDIRIGKGPIAAKGKIVHVYYSGKLSDGKEFDSVSSGKPFKFRLGQKEVIKGWDLGLLGMRVGGKRTIVIPPSQGYGSKKIGKIPANSTLHFQVELKAVN